MTSKNMKIEVLLEAKNLYKTYTQTSGFFVRRQRTIKALNNVSLSIKISNGRPTCHDSC